MTQETSDLTVKKEGAIATLDFEADSGRGLEKYRERRLSFTVSKTTAKWFL